MTSKIFDLHADFINTAHAFAYGNMVRVTFAEAIPDKEGNIVDTNFRYAIVAEVPQLRQIFENILKMLDDHQTQKQGNSTASKQKPFIDPDKNDSAVEEFIEDVADAASKAIPGIIDALI